MRSLNRGTVTDDSRDSLASAVSDCSQQARSGQLPAGRYGVKAGRLDRALQESRRRRDRVGRPRDTACRQLLFAVRFNDPIVDPHRAIHHTVHVPCQQESVLYHLLRRQRRP